jgi:hypothetical protein
MSRGWRAYFIGLLFSFLSLLSYGTWIGYERNREVADQLVARTMAQYSAKTRIAKPVREEDWKAYKKYREQWLMEQQALDKTKSRPVVDFPITPDGP